MKYVSGFINGIGPVPKT